MPLNKDDEVIALASRDGCLYAGTKYGDLFISKDGGRNWLPFSAGLKNHFLYDLSMYECYLYSNTDRGNFKMALPGCYEYKDIARRYMASFATRKSMLKELIQPGVTLIASPISIVANIEPDKQVFYLGGEKKQEYLFGFLTNDLGKLERPLNVVVKLSSDTTKVETQAAVYSLYDEGQTNAYIVQVEFAGHNVTEGANYTICTRGGKKLVAGTLPKYTASFDAEQSLVVKHNDLKEIKFDDDTCYNEHKLRYILPFKNTPVQDTTKFKSLGVLFPAACGVEYMDERIYT